MIVERAALERRMLEALDAGRIPVVLGPPGAGRTSLLIRLSQALGADRAQYVDVAAAATTPERCLLAVREHCPIVANAPVAAAATESPRQAFDALLALLDQATAADGGAVTFLLDEALEVRTFENFPGLRHVQRETIAHLAASTNRFALTSQFTARAHRALRDAPARFEVIHLPPLEPNDVFGVARQMNGAPAEPLGAHATTVQALSAGRAAYVVLLLEALATMGPTIDPVAALAALMAPEGRLAARCRETYEFRLNRARGYGALKAILGILAAEDHLNLTEIARRLHRTPGSTKDYLSWLEDVDLVSMLRKRYVIEDPVLALYIRLYARPVPPSDADVVREVRAFAERRLLQAAESAPVRAPRPAIARVDRPEPARSGIIEID